MHDLFSDRANFYSSFRPGYSSALINHILSFVEEKKLAWDCATGNGQAARLIAPHFDKVVATDISARQLELAPRLSNVEYAIAPAEDSQLPASSVNLITIAQAYHWLDAVRFNAEVLRVCAPKAVIAAWGYSMFYTDLTEFNELIQSFYTDKLGPYWNFERRLVDEHYKTIEFPYQPLPALEELMSYSWTLEHLEGYLRSWSAVKNYTDQHNEDPVRPFIDAARGIAPSEFIVHFPIFLRIGKVFAE